MGCSREEGSRRSQISIMCPSGAHGSGEIPMKVGVTPQRLLKVILVQILLINLILIALLATEMANRTGAEGVRLPAVKLPSFLGPAPDSKPVTRKSDPHSIPVFQSPPSRQTYVLDSFLERYSSFRYKKPIIQIEEAAAPILEFTATAYDLSYECCGKYPSDPAYGITFTGTEATAGRTIAVDPKIIPLKSNVHIEFPAPYGRMTGWYVAEDTGSRVKGRIIDIFFGKSAFAEARKFGRRKVSVRVLPPKED